MQRGGLFCLYLARSGEMGCVGICFRLAVLRIKGKSPSIPLFQRGKTGEGALLLQW